MGPLTHIGRFHLTLQNTVNKSYHSYHVIELLVLVLSSFACFVLQKQFILIFQPIVSSCGLPVQCFFSAVIFFCLCAHCFYLLALTTIVFPRLQACWVSRWKSCCRGTRLARSAPRSRCPTTWPLWSPRRKSCPRSPTRRPRRSRWSRCPCRRPRPRTRQYTTYAVSTPPSVGLERRGRDNGDGGGQGYTRREAVAGGHGWAGTLRTRLNEGMPDDEWQVDEIRGWRTG